MNKLTTIFTPQVRAWIYRIITAAAPLAVFYGLLTQEAAALWIALVGTFLATSMAVFNTSTKNDDSQ